MRILLAGLFLTSLIAYPQNPSMPGDPSDDYMQMFRNMGGTPAMGGGMGVGMTEDLAVAPDGTAYVIRSVAMGVNPPSGQSWQFELAAISPVDGSVQWKLAIPGAGRVSRPVLASDGKIFLTVDNYQMFYANFTSGGSMMTPDQASSSDGKVLIVAVTGNSASILRTIQTDSDVLSVPKIVTDPSGGYLVYVIGYDMMSWTPLSMQPSSPASTSPGAKTLYAYRSDGTLKFSVKLSGAGNGMKGMMRP